MLLDLSSGDALGNDAADRVLAEMQHLGAAVDLLVTVGDRDRVELAARIVAAQDAGSDTSRLSPSRSPPASRISSSESPRQSPRLVTKLKMPPLPLLVAGIPVLHGRIFDLGIVQRDQLDHRGVELVFVAHRSSATFEIADVGALVGDDQCALELAGIFLR